jgi:predicted AAA+ superfamily ATPase
MQPVFYKQAIIDILSEVPFQGFNESYLHRNIPLPKLPHKALIFVGVRRSGKTTFIKEIKDSFTDKKVENKQIIYFNFSDERLYGMSTHHLQLIASIHEELFSVDHNNTDIYFFFDEPQYVEGWELFVDRLLRKSNYHIFITGSSAKLLSKEIASSLRGRGLSFEIFPFSFLEFIKWKKLPNKKLLTTTQKHKLSKELTHYLKWGGFPETINHTDDFKRKILSEYKDVLLFRDIIERNNIQQPQLANWLFHYFLSQTSSTITINKTHDRLKSLEYKIDKTFISDFISWCEDCYCFFAVSIFSESITKRSINPRKIYPVDNGLFTLVSGFQSENFGRYLESSVFQHLRRSTSEIYYYKTAKGYEVDFTVLSKKKNIRYFIQVVYSLNDIKTLERELRALQETLSENPKSKGLIVIQELPPSDLYDENSFLYSNKNIQWIEALDFFLNIEQWF